MLSSEQFSVGVDIAIKALQYGFWYSDRRAGEIKDALRVIFGDDIVAAAVSRLTGNPPTVTDTPPNCDTLTPPTCGTLEFQYTQIGIGAPTNTPIDVSGNLRPPTFEQRHDANVATLQELHDMVWGDSND